MSHEQRNENAVGTARGTAVLDDPAVRPVRTRRRGRRVVGTILALLLAGIAIVLVGVALVAGVARFLPSLNPFATEEVDRSGPAVLQAIEDLSEHRGAVGHFQVVLDVEEDARFLPSAIRGERTLFVAVGEVDATVELAGLGPEAVEVSADRTTATIRLPSAQLGRVRVDPEASYVYARDRGLIDRLQGLFSDSPTSERALYVLAEERLREAAEDTDLRATAERNTRLMLTSLLHGLGFTDVTVTFD